MKSSNSFLSSAIHYPLSPFISPPQLILNDRTIPITVGSAGGINVLNSAHPCVESPCANGGTCRPKWDSYECDCPLGYDGRHCQKGQLQMIWATAFDSAPVGLILFVCLFVYWLDVCVRISRKVLLLCSVH